MKFEVNFKERLYFGIMATIGIMAYSFMVRLLFANFVDPKIFYIYLAYAAVFGLFSFLMKTFLVGFIKGNAIRIHEKQFPDVFNILKSHSNALGLAKIPALYVLQGGGMLNAFAMRFTKKNFVVLYSSVFELAYEEGMDAVSFIIGHELGHIKRNHVGFLKLILTLPARVIPFMGTAYSRACEYTCDNIGYNLSNKGALNGLMILAAGKKLYKKVSVLNLINNTKDFPGFAFWFAEIFASHPHLVNRLDVINELTDDVDLDIEKNDFVFANNSAKESQIQQ